MTEGIDLRSYQLESVKWLRERLESNHHAILAHPPGLGKTIIAAAVVQVPALVVCPASVVLHWEKELKTWRPDLRSDLMLGHLKVVSYEKLVKMKVKSRHLKFLIVDEIHYAKNPDAIRTKKVCRLIHNVRKRGNVVVLSGTLVPNRPIELWPLMYSSGITKRDYGSFARKYAGAWMNQWNELDVSGARNLDELRELLEPHCLRYEKSEVLSELPPIQWRVIALNLPVDEREREMRKDLLRKVEHPIPRSAMSDLLHQHALRKLPLALKHVEGVLDEKEDAKVLVFAYHRDVIAELKKGLSKHGVASIVGGMTAKDKQANERAFQRDDSRIRVFIGQIGAAGIGINLNRANRVIFVEGSWVPAVLEQAADRAHRIGTKGMVLADVLTIYRSVDEHMLRRALEKREIVEQIVQSRRFTSSSSRPSIFD